jgi:hypothetical protein
MFFQPADASLRKPIEVITDTDNITDGCEQQINKDVDIEGAEYDGMMRLQTEVKYI